MRDFDIDMDIPGIEPPLEDIPNPPSDEELEENQDEAEAEGLQPEEEVYTHFLTPMDSPNHPHRKRPDYKDRIESEKRAWNSQLDLLTAAYLEWEAGGPLLLKEGSSFQCRVISIFCKCSYTY